MAFDLTQQPVAVGQNYLAGVQAADLQDQRQARNALLNLQLQDQQQKLADRTTTRNALSRFAQGDASARTDLLGTPGGADILKTLDADKKAKLAERAAAANSILNLPADQREPAYQAMRTQAAQNGEDVRQWPANWDDRVGQSLVALGTTLQQQLEMGKPTVIGEGAVAVDRNGRVIAQGSPKQHTLAPGGQLVDGNGKVIAAAPDRPMTVAPGGAVVDPRTGRVVFTSPERPVAVGQGAALVDPRTGQPVYTAPDRPVAVGPGSTLVDPRSGAAVFSAPDRALVEVQDPQNPNRTIMVPRAQAANMPGARNVAPATAAESAIGKLQADLRAGRITQDEYNLGVQKLGNNVRVDVNTAEQPFLKDLGGLAAKDIYASRDAAKGAVKQLDAINTARDLLDKGVITGTGANFKTSVARAFGMDVGNTEAFMATMGQQTLALVKNLGSGSGISNADRDYAEKVAGGNIELSEQGLRRILDINERAARAVAEQHNKTVAPLLSDPNVPSYIRSSLPVTVPEARKPAAPGKPLDAATLNSARDAVARGAPRDAVVKRLQENGYDVSKF